MPTLEGPAGTIYYETAGGAWGDPTVLVHGSWVDHRSWARVVPSLAQGLHVITYDRRGHGGSSGARRERPVRDDASDLARLLESIDLFPAHVVGHSYGGAVALRLAVDRPELVRSVAVHEPPFLGLLPEDDPMADEASRARADVRRLQARVRTGDLDGAAREFVDRFSPDLGEWDRLDPTVHGQLARNAERWAEELDDPEAMCPSRTGISGLDIPVLLTSGERSSPLFHGIEAELLRTLRNASARRLPACGHAPHLTHPEMYVGVLAMFLLEREVPPT